jgi:predicted GNAT family acetyltransferase
VKQALDETRDDGLLVEPYCPFTRRYIKEHPEYLDLVPENRREDFELPERASS